MTPSWFRSFVSRLSRISSRPFLKFLVTILGAVVLSAIGSGLWNLILQDVVVWIGRSILQAISFVYAGYADLLHSTIGAAGVDPFPLLRYIILVGAGSFGFIAGVLSRRYADSKRHLADQEAHLVGAVESGPTDVDNAKKAVTPQVLLERTRKLRISLRRDFALLTLYVGTVALLFLFQTLQDNYRRRACIFIEQSIDILAPEISPHEVLDLRAQFRSVDTSNKFYELEAKIRNLAGTCGSNLPEFRSIRSK